MVPIHCFGGRFFGDISSLNSDISFQLLKNYKTTDRGNGPRDLVDPLGYVTQRLVVFILKIDVLLYQITSI